MKVKGAITIQLQSILGIFGVMQSGYYNISNYMRYFHGAPVAQMDRAIDFESIGRGFDPCQARQKNQ